MECMCEIGCHRACVRCKCDIGWHKAFVRCKCVEWKCDIGCHTNLWDVSVLVRTCLALHIDVSVLVRTCLALHIDVSNTSRKQPLCKLPVALRLDALTSHKSFQTPYLTNVLWHPIWLIFQLPVAVRTHCCVAEMWCDMSQRFIAHT